MSSQFERLKNKMLSIEWTRTIDWAKFTIASSMGALFVGFFAFFAKIQWTKFLETTPLHLVLFPFAAIVEAVDFLLTVLDIVTAKNRNAARVSHLGLKLLVTPAIVIAVIGFMAFGQLFAIAGPAMFIAAMGAVALFNGGLLLLNLYKWYTTPADIGGRELDSHKQYANNITRYSIMFVGMAVPAAAVGLLMIAHVALAITATLAGAALGFSVLYGLWKKVGAPLRDKIHKILWKRDGTKETINDKLLQKRANAHVAANNKHNGHTDYYLPFDYAVQTKTIRENYGLGAATAYMQAVITQTSEQKLESDPEKAALDALSGRLNSQTDPASPALSQQSFWRSESANSRIIAGVEFLEQQSAAAAAAKAT